jgi:enoyl-CoA hydratase/carnithine racemase
MAGGTGARLGVTELLVGVPFPPVALALLRRRAGRHAARLAMLGPTYEAEAALELGLVDELAPPDRVLGRARELARALAASGAAFSVTKRQLLRPMLEEIDRARLEFEQVVDATWMSEAALDRIRTYARTRIRANVSASEAQEDA